MNLFFAHSGNLGVDGKDVRLTAQDLIKMREQEKTGATS